MESSAAGSFFTHTGVKSLDCHCFVVLGKVTLFPLTSICGEWTKMVPLLYSDGSCRICGSLSLESY